jgi:hypothetical protein
MYFWNINEVTQWERLYLIMQSFNALEDVTKSHDYLFASMFDPNGLYRKSKQIIQRLVN